MSNIKESNAIRDLSLKGVSTFGIQPSHTTHLAVRLTARLSGRLELWRAQSRNGNVGQLIYLLLQL